MKPKKKVFIDVGTNRFQGYDQLVGDLGITNDWVKIFVEPNPNFIKDSSLVKKFHEIPNSVYVNAAVCQSKPCGTEVEFIHKDDPKHDQSMDQGGSIYTEKNRPGYTTCPVKTVTLEEVLKNYMEDDWYFKFDCEGCEFDCLEGFLEKYAEKIKFLACEFHHPGNPSDPEYLKKKESMMEIINRNGIRFKEWH